MAGFFDTLDIFGFGDEDAPDTSGYYRDSKAEIDKWAATMPDEYKELSPHSLQKLGPSAMDGVSTDPELRAAQQRALRRMQEVGDKGYTIEEEAAMNRIQGQNAQAERGRRESIMQDMQARGMGNSGATLAAQLQSASAANQNASEQSQDVAANAQRRALQAMAQSGDMAGRMRGQEFDEKSRVAAARDRVNEFNTGNAVKAQFQNNSGQNNFAQQRFGNYGDVSSARTGVATNQANSETAKWAGEQEAKDRSRDRLLKAGVAGAKAYGSGGA
jgi:hypothetical protein